MTHAQAISTRMQRKRVYAVLMASSAPLALAVALSSTQATAAGLPVPSVPPPNQGTNWVAATPGQTSASVTVTGSRAYAEWQSFDVAAGNTFTVNGQVGKDWILVNRVVGSQGVVTPSMLAGTIAANGQVWLLNRSGIIVSNTGVFNVGGLLLSTAGNFDKQSYLTGGLGINFSGATKAIQMDGTVNASGGLVAFLAPVVNIGGQVRETSPGVAQFAAVAAQDVSLMFTDTGAQLALDGVTIDYGSDVPGNCEGNCPTSGGISQTAGSQITASRIILAAAGANLTSSIVVGGGLTATRARSDGQDIVLIVADPTNSDSPSAELSAGAFVPGSTTTNFGGDITVDTALINTLATSIADPLAANGASLFVRDAGNVHIGTIVNAVGDVDILAQGAIDQANSNGGNIAARDIALASLNATTFGALTARDDVVAQVGSFTATSITAGATVAGQGPVDAMGAADRLLGTSMPGHNVNISSAGSINVLGATSAIQDPLVTTLQSDVTMVSSGEMSTARISTGAITAGRDIDLSLTAYGQVTTGALQSRRDIAISTYGGISVASADAGDDIVMRADNDISVAGALTTHGADVSTATDPNQPADLLAASNPTSIGETSFALTGSSIDLHTFGAITVGGQVTAMGPQSDVRMEGFGVSVAGVNAGQDILLSAFAFEDGPDVVAGDLVAGRDIALTANQGAITLNSAVAGDDIVLRAFGDITVNGVLTTQGADVSTATDPNQAGDVLAASDPLVYFGQTAVLTGSSIDVGAGRGGTGILTVGGFSTAVGAQSDARFVGPDAITVGGVSAGEDVVVDAPSASVLAGALQAGRDVAVLGQAGINLVSATAADDIVLRASGAIAVSGGLATSGADVSTDTAPAQAGDLLYAQFPTTEVGLQLSLTGSTIDVGGQSVTVKGASVATGSLSDARFNASGPNAIGDVTAGEDVIIGSSSGLSKGGNLVAGRDISVGGTGVNVSSGSAGGDIIMRASGPIIVSGTLKTTGKDASPAPTPGLPADALAAAQPIVDFGVTFSLTGSTIDLASNSTITVGGQVTTVGPQADARFDGVGVTLAGVNAGRDILIDSTLNGSGAISAGALVAARDIAARSGSTLGLASAAAGSNIVLRSPSSILVKGGLTSSGKTVTGANPVGVLLAAADPITAFGTTFALVGPSIDVKAGTTLTIQGAVAELGGDSRLQGPAGITLAAVSAGQDVLLDSASGAVVAGNTAAGRDIAIRGATSVTVASGKAGDDIVLRGPGPISVTGSLITLGLDVSTTSTPAQAGDVLAAYDPITALGATFALGGSNIDIKSNAVVLANGSMTASGAGSDVRIQTPSTINIEDATAGQDILLDGSASENGGSVLAGNLTAGRDVAVRSSSGAVTLSSASAGDDIVLRSPSSISVVGGLTTSGSDVPLLFGVFQAGDQLAASDPIVAFGATFGATGSTIDVKAGGDVTVGGPTMAMGGASDARFVGQTVSLAAVNAGEDILIDGGGFGVSAGALVAGRDIGVDAEAGALTLASGDAGDDLVLRAAADITVAGSLMTEGRDSPTAKGQAGDSLYAFSPLVYFGQTLALTGSSIDVIAGASVTVSGQTNAVGALSDARFEATGPLTLAGVTAGEDVVLGTALGFGSTQGGGEGEGEGGGAPPTPTLTSGILIAGRDVAVNSAADASIASGAAGGVIVIRAQGDAAIAGGLTASGAAAGSPGQAASLLYNQAPTNDFAAVLALVDGTVDVGAFGAVTVGGAASAGPSADARFVGGTDVTVASVTAGADVLLQAGDSANAGALVAQRDVAISADGDISLASAQAGDDIVLSATVQITVNGSLTTLGQDVSTTSAPSQAGDVLAAYDPITAFNTTFGLTGSSIDIKSDGPVLVFGAMTAAGSASDVRVQSLSTINIQNASAGEDVLIDGPPSEADEAISAGNLSAGRDVAVRSSSGAITLNSAIAGDDIVLRSPSSITVQAGLTTQGADVSTVGAPDQAGDLLAALDPISAFGATFVLAGSSIDVKAGGAVTAGAALVAIGPRSDVRIQTPGSLSIADVSAGEDVLLDGSTISGVVSAGNLVAGRDIGARSSLGALTLASAQAGDDIVIRSTGAVTVTGALTTLGQDVSSATPNQAGELLYASSPNTALSGTYTLTGSNIDIVGQQGITVSGQVTAAGTTSDARFQSAGAVSLAGVTAGRDIVIDPTAPAAGVSAGALIAGRDIAAQALAGPITLVSAQAGDDIVLRSGGALTVTGALITTGAGSDGAGAGDQLVKLSPSQAYWAAGAPPFSASGGHDIDIRATGSIILGGRLTANGAGAGVRIDSYGAGGTVSTVGITIAGGSGSEQVFIAGSDVALSGAINAPTADVLLFSRTTTGVTTLGGGATGLGGAFTFDNTEVAQVTAASLDLFSGVDPAHTGNIAVQNLTFTSGLQTIRVYAGAGSRIDVFGAVSDPVAGGRFDVGAAGTDTTLPKFALNGASAVVLSTWRPDVVRIAGTIGVGGVPLTDVSLAGQSIFIAPEPDTTLSSNFEQASQSTTPLPLYSGSDTLQVFTGTLELRASGQVLERDLRTTATGQGAGVEIGKLVVDKLDVTGAAPSRLSLYGVINQNLTGVVPPPNPTDLVGGRYPSLKLVFSPAANASVLFPQPAGSSYTFNGCAFGTAAGCTGNAPDTTPTDVFILSDSLLEQDVLAAVIPPRIVIRNVQDVVDPYTPVEEEGVTNMGGEVGWMPENEPEVCTNDETTLCKNGAGNLNTGPSR